MIPAPGAGISFIGKARENLNDVISEKDLLESLASPGYNRGRNQPAFRKLLQ